MNLEVKWGLITLIRQTVDLCDELTKVDLKCPLEKGEMTLTKDVDLPQQIPPVCLSQESQRHPLTLSQGSYSVLADVYNQNKQQVTCLRGNDIKFHIR